MTKASIYGKHAVKAMRRLRQVEAKREDAQFST